MNVLINEPAWVGRGLYLYHMALKRGGQEGLANMKESSALTETFWKQIEDRYEDFLNTLIDDASMEVLGAASLYGMTTLIDNEFVAELNVSSNWIRDDQLPFLKQIKNLYQIVGSEDEHHVYDLEFIRDMVINRRKARLERAYKEDTDDAEMDKLVFERSMDVAMELSQSRSRHPTIIPELNYLAIFPEISESNEERSYKLPLLDAGEIESATLTLKNNPRAAMSFIDPKQERLIREAAKQEVVA